MAPPNARTVERFEEKAVHQMNSIRSVLLWQLLMMSLGRHIELSLLFERTHTCPVVLLYVFSIVTKRS